MKMARFLTVMICVGIALLFLGSCGQRVTTFSATGNETSKPTPMHTRMLSSEISLPDADMTMTPSPEGGSEHGHFSNMGDVRALQE